MECARILVIGDWTVGKSSYLNYICNGVEESLPKTKGMEVYVLEKEFQYIEFYELGGEALEIDEIAKTYLSIGGFNGLIMIYD